MFSPRSSLMSFWSRFVDRDKLRRERHVSYATLSSGLQTPARNAWLGLVIMSRFARGCKKKETNLLIGFFRTPKRFRTAVAGMKIPSPGPLDDRGDLCDQI